jgi:N-acetylglucosaminyl-diphospho-decaprenol L-rhamnosyltransferase
MHYELSVQIVNYNTKNYLIKCIKDIISDLKFSGIIFHILVLDNNSKDDITDIPELFRGIDIAVFRSDANLGFGGGHNYLYNLTKSTYMLILNPDIELLEINTIKTLLDYLKKHPKVSVLGPKLISHDYRAVEYDHGELYGLKSWYRNNLGESYWHERFRAGEVAWVSGAFLMIRQEIFKKVEGFDEKYFMYKEEEDLCLRVRKIGHKVYYYPFVKALHYTEASSNKSDFIESSRNYYIKKNLRGKLCYKILVVIRKIYNKFGL